MKIHVEIFLAAQLLQREQGTFTAQDIVDRVRQEWGDERPGVSTHASAHCVANAKANTATPYNYLWRIEHGRYRCFDPARDQPHPSRAGRPAQPVERDVPVAYRWALRGI